MKRRGAFWSGVLLFCLLVCGWVAPASAQRGSNELQIRILAFNDFHGHISTDGLPDKGSAPVLAAYLQDAAKDWQDRIFLVHAGDLVGGSQAASAYLQEEPSISFMNLLAERHAWKIIGTPGNHEFDQGQEEMLRLLHGGKHKKGAFLEKPYPGAKFTTICANVIKKGGDPLLLPFVIRRVEGVPIAFIGAVTISTRGKVNESGIEGLSFKNEAAAINSQVESLKRWGIKAFVVLIHEGGCGQPLFAGKTGPHSDKLRGRIVEIVNRLDDEVDVVISGHTHNFTNVLIKKPGGKTILVTQANKYGEAFAEIDLTVDRGTGEVVAKWAQIKPTFRNRGPGLHPDPKVAHLVQQAEAYVKKWHHDTQEFMRWARKDLGKRQNSAGESVLGDLVADSYRMAGQTKFAVVNPGGIRADQLARGEITWGALFCVQPFKDKLVKMKLTGQQMYYLLQQQWQRSGPPVFLQISGFRYAWDDHSTPPGIVMVNDDQGNPLDKTVSYEVTTNSYLAEGHDGFTMLANVPRTEDKNSPSSLEALVAYIKAKPEWDSARIDNRITKISY